MLNVWVHEEINFTKLIHKIFKLFGELSISDNNFEECLYFKKDRKQKTSKNGGKCMCLTLMDKKWCTKYLSLCSSLVYVLNDCHAVEVRYGSGCFTPHYTHETYTFGLF